MRQESIRFIFLCLALNLFYFVPLLAESVELAGITFPYNSTLQEDPGFIQVEIDGEKQIVKNTEVEDYVLTYYLNSPNFEITTAQFALMFNGLVNQGKFVLLKQLYEYAVKHQLVGKSLPEPVELLLPAIPVNNLLEMSAVCRSINCNSSQSLIIVEAAVKNSEKVRSEATLELIRLRSEILEAIDKKFVQSVSTREYSQISKYLKLINELYPEESKRIRTLTLFDSSLQKAFQAMPTGDLELFTNLFDAAQAMPDLQHALRIAFHDNSMERAKTYYETAKKIPVYFWMYIDPKSATPDMHKYVLSSITQLTAEDWKYLADYNLLDSLSKLAEYNSELRSTLAIIIENLIDRQLVLAIPEQAERYLEYLKKIPDITASLDKCRLKIAEGYRAVDKIKEQNRIISQISKTSGFMFGLQLAWFKYGIWLLTFCTVILLCSLFLIYKFVLKPKYQAEEVEEEVDEEELASTFKILTNRSSGLLIEYESLMAELGMPKESSQKAIKSRFRAVMKDLHPDINHSTDFDVSAALGDVKKKFDDIFRLRKQLGLDKE